MVEVVFVLSKLETAAYKWNEGRLYHSLLQFLPRVVPKPRVILDLFRPVETQSIAWLSLDHLVYEVGSCDAPPLRDVPLLYLHLL